MQRGGLAAGVFAAATGALVWAISPLLTGHAEPWDADGWYYVGALAVTGLVAGAVFPRSRRALYLGIVAGQAGYQAVFLTIGPLFSLGLLLLSIFSLVFVAASVLAAHLRNLPRFFGGPGS